MKKHLHQIALSTSQALVLTLILSACGKSAPNVGKQIRLEEKPLTASSAVRAQLAKINEDVPATGTLVWMNKEFWINRSIWISLGVERASMTGLAMSVDGYHAAKITRAGSFLVLSRDNTGLFGGTVLGPDLPLNAYPIMSESATEILVDLAAPKTPYGLTMINFTAGEDSSAELQPRFEYVKEIETTETSLSYTTVTTTKSPVPLFTKEDQTAEALSGQDPYLLSMTLRMDWVIPTENPGFIAKLAEQSVGFFLGTPKVVENGQGVQQMVQKIATNKPFVWEVSANTPAEYREAIAQGITGWNSSVGGDNVLQVQFADKMGSVTKPSTSNLVWDDNMAVGFAFANWRSNPTTGEIVQAQVYLSGSMWAQGAQITFQLRDIEKQIRESAAAMKSPNVATREKARKALLVAKNKLSKLHATTKELAKKTTGSFNKRSFVSFNSDLSSQRAAGNAFCMRPVEIQKNLLAIAAIDSDLDEALKELDGETEAERQPDVVESEHDFASHLPYPSEGMDAATFSKYVVRAVVLHEVGHTIGLRHNFMGSLGTSKKGEVLSASIMDYNDEVIDAQFAEPGDWDKAIASFTYQDKAIEPESGIKFCTDEQAAMGIPTCAPFDFSASPAHGQHIVEESNLMVAQMFLYFGRPDIAMALVMRALGSNIQKIQHALFPADIATQMLMDPEFEKSQKDAWSYLQESMSMQELGYPADFVQAYKEILINLMTQATTPLTATSANASDLLNFYKETLLASETTSLELRKAVIKGMQNIQTTEGRVTMTEALIALSDRLASVENPALLTPAQKVALIQDQDIIVNLRKILLDDGYFKSPEAEAKN